MASEPENRTAGTTVERMQLVGEWLEYLSGARGGAKGFIVFRSLTDRYVQFAFDPKDERVRVEVGTFEWQKELGRAIPARAEERLVRKDFNAPDWRHLNYWQDIDRFRSHALSSMAEWAFRDVFEELADFRLSVGTFEVYGNRHEVRHVSEPEAPVRLPPSTSEVVEAAVSLDVGRVGELLRDHARDDICTGLQSLGANARMAVRGRPEESMGKGSSLGIIDIDDGPIDWVNVRKVDSGLTEFDSSTTYYTDYGFKVPYRPPNATIKSVLIKTGPLFGNAFDGEWRAEGSDRGSGLVADVLRRLEEDAQVTEAVIAIRDVEITGHPLAWVISMKTGEIPTRQAWDCYQAIAWHLIEAGREEPNTE